MSSQINVFVHVHRHGLDSMDTMESYIGFVPKWGRTEGFFGVWKAYNGPATAYYIREFLWREL